MLIKVRADAATRSQVLEMVQMFRAKVVDVATESLTIEATGTTEKLHALLEVLEPSGPRARAVGDVRDRPRAALDHGRALRSA